MKLVIDNIILTQALNTLEVRAFMTNLWNPFDEKWSNFLWENGFLATDITPINSLANLLLSYFNTQIVPNLSGKQILLNNQPLLLTQTGILGMFGQHCKRNVFVDKHGKRKLTTMRLPKMIWSLEWPNKIASESFLNWIERKVAYIQEPVKIFDK
jgi:hypothetical protein